MLLVVIVALAHVSPPSDIISVILGQSWQWHPLPPDATRAIPSGGRGERNHLWLDLLEYQIWLAEVSQPMREQQHTISTLMLMRIPVRVWSKPYKIQATGGEWSLKGDDGERFSHPAELCSRLLPERGA